MDSVRTGPAPQRRGAAPALIEEIVPPPAVCADTRGDVEAPLLPGEHAHVARALPSRRAEFVTGRACARLALARLGFAARPVPPGLRGEPTWPPGVVGSITHCAGYRGAAVARSAQVAGLGIDAEPNAPLPEGVLEAISLPAERAWVERYSAAHAGVCWDRLLFSAKESVYKAWYPLARRWLDFEDAAVAVEVGRGRFTATLRTAGPVLGGRELTEFTGRWVQREQLILTAVTVVQRADRPSGANVEPQA